MHLMIGVFMGFYCLVLQCCGGYVNHSQRSQFTDAAYWSENLDYHTICCIIVQVIFLENINNNQFNKVICFCSADYPAPRAVLTGHDQEVVCVAVCAELGLVISGAKGECPLLSPFNSETLMLWDGKMASVCYKCITSSRGQTFHWIH